ncbi:probable ATP-dependent RNA helicase DDX49 [Gigantopelta aegis]|uniref:probable ATP-dependent RNA helicase DDX49 n=1 Tax=Gigantopelta aegis TaxID=1735272 RepID=UPI001B88A0E2|nr:probable ATP-dependent RNA helicase DDX49 [Gigantopelta aegis]XP_041368371.1 probable ATP-dependent RNA helicase DDX49 [Gigantopelta aegis]
MSLFKDLGLNDWLADQCTAMGLSKPTPIQLQCVPHILQGDDCIGCAKTGSGKTAAFALPILQKLAEDPYGIFALVLTPTRELAFQIAEQFSVLGKPIGVRVTVITGGLDMMKQGIDLSVKPHIVISTPGRLADHINSCKTFSLKRIKFLVLDEADRLLEDNFGSQLEEIFKVIPTKRQTLLFSATMTDTIQQLQEVSTNKPFFWQQQSSVATVDELTQTYVLMPADLKDAYLIHILQKCTTENNKGSIIIFTSTCKYTQIIGMICHELGFPTVVLHSMIPQKQRLAALAKFKSNQVQILIATDVASRGLDILTVDFIINHNVPNRQKDYVHRVGRTARAGRGGLAITLVTQFDIKLVHAIEEFINTKLTEYKTVEKEVMEILTEVTVARREAEIKLDEQDFGEKKAINKRKQLILEGKDPDKEGKKSRRSKEEKEAKNKKYKERFIGKKKKKQNR